MHEMHDMRETERLIFGCERTRQEIELMESDSERASQRVEQAMRVKEQRVKLNRCLYLDVNERGRKLS